MRPTKVAMFSVAILCVTSLCAFAHTLGKPTSPLPKEPRAMMIRPGFRRHSRPSLRVAPFKLYRGQVAS
ncbi:hypothetical protein F7R02_24700 [Xanthomonas cissicola]|nr:hypothetical protein F7R02_24700 [Xanthomonas cissicola]